MWGFYLASFNIVMIAVVPFSSKSPIFSPLCWDSSIMVSKAGAAAPFAKLDFGFAS
jgi:hypothetical protein